MEIGHIIPHIEALVFASDRPLTAMDITELVNNAFGFMEDKITLDQVESSLEGIVEKYQSEFYPFEMRESGGGWQFLTKKDFHKTVAQLNGEKFLKRLSNAALETLAIIAYKQPITKGDIEAIRGVSSDYSIQKLLEKELIVITGRNEDMPGKPLVYATSKSFMDYFGLNSVDDLPKLKEIFDEAMVPPTVMQEDNNAELGEQNTSESEEAEAAALIVSENGELIESTEEISEIDEDQEQISSADIEDLRGTIEDTESDTSMIAASGQVQDTPEENTDLSAETASDRQGEEDFTDENVEEEADDDAQTEEFDDEEDSDDDADQDDTDFSKKD